MANNFLLAFTEFNRQQTVVTMTLILLLQPACSWPRVSANGLLTLDKPQLVLGEGSSDEVTCSPRIGSVVWINPLGKVVSYDNRSRVHFDPVSGRLTLREVNVTDCGRYFCVLNLMATCGCSNWYSYIDRRHVVPFELQVCKIPTPLAGAIMLGIEVILIVFVSWCVVRIAYRRRQIKIKPLNLPSAYRAYRADQITIQLDIRCNVLHYNVDQCMPLGLYAKAVDCHSMYMY